jgi:putative ABC transport system permease protein
VCALVALAALIPAPHAGRLSAVGAMTAGQAPRTARGYTAHRPAGKLALPRPVSVGLAAPFTRPARTATITATIVFGAIAVILAVGLNSSLAKMQQLGSNHGPPYVSVVQRRGSVQPTLTRSQSRAATAAIRAQPGTLRHVAVADDGKVINSVSVPACQA